MPRTMRTSGTRTAFRHLHDLGDPSHLESGDAATGARIGRSAFFKLLWEP